MIDSFLHSRGIYEDNLVSQQWKPYIVLREPQIKESHKKIWSAQEVVYIGQTLCTASDCPILIC